MSNLFENPEADLIIRSADGVEFRVFRRILSEASPFFGAMLSLPQPPSDLAITAPVIDVSEDSKIFGTLLQLVYPFADPSISTLDEISSLLAVAVKYDMIRAIETLRRLLVGPNFLEESPTRVYAIACRFDLEEESRIASRYTLRVNVLDCPLSEDLKYITAYSYHRLLDLHRKRGEAAQELLKMDETLKCIQCSSSHYGGFCPPRWWTDFELRARKELKARPTTDVIFTLEFLSRSMNTGCQRCPSSILDSFSYFNRLRKEIDDLPSTV